MKDGHRAETGFAASAFDVLVRLRGRHRRAIAWLLYAGIGAVAYCFAYLLRFEFAIPPAWTGRMLVTLPALVGIRILVTWIFRLGRGRWRFVGTEDVRRLVIATTTGSAGFYVLVWVVGILPIVPRSVILIEWLLTTLMTAGAWIGYRLAFERTRRVPGSGAPGRVKRALIIGAGEAGNLLAREMGRQSTGYRLVGFVDDDPLMHGSTVRGVRVLGGTDGLAGIAERSEAEVIIIAIPSATPARLRDIVERCEPLQASLKVLPGIADVLRGDVEVGQLRELRIEDLLGRDPITLELPELAPALAGRSVLITGGAGSIGSELARQIARYGPGRLVLLDQAESDLYFLERELEARHPDLELVAVVGDVLDDRGLADLFERTRPERVFHAAAHKHVPLMETNVRQAIRNNVLGTMAVARAVGNAGAEAFTLISTDKAVEPTSVMGATKRIAERVCVGCQETFPETSFTAVRFGNVLGSQGSVIPLFRRQLGEGGPLTVTHPDATRYFMTISEAVQLVLQASILPESRGRITMLDMGEPVRIVDLARDLIRLAGLRPGIDVGIEIIGLRPGERLHERLETSMEATVPTAIDRIRVVRSRTSAPETWILAAVEALAARLDDLSEPSLRPELSALVEGPDHRTVPGERPEAASLGRSSP